jgi:hypothetical protein
VRAWQARQHVTLKRSWSTPATVLGTVAALVLAAALLYGTGLGAWVSRFTLLGGAFAGPSSAKVLEGLEPLDHAPLAAEPRNIAADLGGRAAFDPRTGEYAVGPTTSRWIARAARVQSQTVHLQANLSVKDWIGTGGFAWQIVEPGEQQLENNRWFTAEFFRFSQGESCLLVVRELRLDSLGLVADNSALRRVEIPLPEDKSAVLNVLIQEKRLRIEFAGNEIVEVLAPVKEVQSWTGGGDLILGFTGDGKKTTFSGVVVGTPRQEADQEKR